VIELLEQQKKLTANQWKLIATANLADLLDFFDFFLIGYVLAFITKEWQLTYWQGAVILLSSGLGAVPGAFFWGWVADRIGRRKVFISTALNVALATGVMYFTPGQGGWVAGWIFLSVMRFFVGVGNAGLITVDMPLVQEFMPAYKRGWVSVLTTTLLPAGNLLGGVAGWLLAPVIGWRGLFLIGLVPIVLVLMIRYWVPESPRWLIRMGRHEDARKSLAWALQIDPKLIDLPTTLPEAEKVRWRELFKYPRSIAAACLTGLTQTGGVGLLLWQTTLFVLVLKVTPAEASYLVIWVSLIAIIGRFFVMTIIEALGRRGSGVLCCLIAAVAISIAGYMPNIYVGTASMFFVMILVTVFFGSGNYSIVGPYMAEVWPTRLRTSGMGLGYGIGNMGKIIGPLGLALIAGSSDYISPKATLDALGLAFLYFGSCGFSAPSPSGSSASRPRAVPSRRWIARLQSPRHHSRGCRPPSVGRFFVARGGRKPNRKESEDKVPLANWCQTVLTWTPSDALADHGLPSLSAFVDDPAASRGEPGPIAGYRRSRCGAFLSAQSWSIFSSYAAS
jgi:MFS transporter, putative metabolite:H+ symporter